MKKHGILMTPENAERCYRRTKTVTRRRIKTQPVGVAKITKHNNGWLFLDDENRVICRMTPKYRVGDIVAIKETHWRYGRHERDEKGNWRFIPINKGIEGHVRFASVVTAKEKHDIGYHKRPAIFLPFDFARTHWEILDARPERLHDMTDREAFREGYPGRNASELGPLAWFVELWDSINAKKAPWESNLWVWRYEGQKVQP